MMNLVWPKGIDGGQVGAWLDNMAGIKDHPKEAEFYGVIGHTEDPPDPVPR
jgi:hypothetical protein